MALQKVRQASKSAAPALVSMSPDAFTFGLIDDVDVEFTDAACATAKQVPEYTVDDPETPLFLIEMTDVNGSAHNQFYSLGKSEDWEPSAGGEGFVAVSGKTSINATSNLGMFLKSLVEQGFPTDILATGNLKSIIGTKCHVMMKQTERKSLVRKSGQSDRPSGVLLVSKIHSLPGADNKAATKAVVGKTVIVAGKTTTAIGKTNSGAAAAALDPNADIDTVLVEKLTEALAETDPLPKKSLLSLASAAFKGTNLHAKAIQRANQADFLKSLPESGISFSGSEFSLA